MKIIFGTLLCLFLIIGDTVEGRRGRPCGRPGKPYKGPHGGRDSPFMDMVKDIMGGDLTCPDSSAFVTRITQATCSETKCKDFATDCMIALMPPGERCQRHTECKEEIMSTIQGKPSKEDQKKKMIKCVMGKLLASVNVVISDDVKQNALNYLDATIGQNETMASAYEMLYTAVEDGDCVPANFEDYKLSDDLIFHVCIRRKCVYGMMSTV